MAETDDIVARLNRMIARDATGYTITLDPDVISLAAAALTEKAATIERLEKSLRMVQNAAKTIASCQGTELEHLRQNYAFDQKLRAEVESLREANSLLTNQTDAAEARAETAERERDEARAEVERLRELFRSDGEQHAQFVKTLTEAHEVRITKYADAFNEMRTDVERKDAALLRIAERCRRPDLVARAALEEEGKT
jgi:tRNA/tmRNA/rRNA uracil-C5-methylase (TrmA/RlmC/RlmD family)